MSRVHGQAWSSHTLVGLYDDYITIGFVPSVNPYLPIDKQTTQWNVRSTHSIKFDESSPPRSRSRTSLLPYMCRRHRHVSTEWRRVVRNALTPPTRRRAAAAARRPASLMERKKEGKKGPSGQERRKPSLNLYDSGLVQLAMKANAGYLTSAVLCSSPSVIGRRLCKLSL